MQLLQGSLDQNSVKLTLRLCPFQTMLSQDQLLNDSRLPAPDSDDWR